MIKLLKHYFVPHKGNDHKPHFLRFETIQGIVIAIIVIELIFIVAPFFSFIKFDASKFMASVLPSVVASLTNQNREENNLPDLVENSVLDQAAQLKANDMVAKGYFAHVSPEGKAPWYWFKQAGYNYEYAGENLAVDFTDSKDVTDAWMKSPTHRANIVKAAYTEVGTGIASGMFEGKQTTFVVQMYGKPKPADTAVTKPAEVQTSSPSKDEPRVATTKTEKIADMSQPPILLAAGNPDEVKPEVLGAETSDIEISNPIVSFVKESISSPRHTFNTILVIVLALAVIAMLLKVLIRVDMHHPALITNGLVLAALVIGIYGTNIFIAKASAPHIGSGSSIAETTILAS